MIHYIIIQYLSAFVKSFFRINLSEKKKRHLQDINLHKTFFSAVFPKYFICSFKAAPNNARSRIFCHIT